MLLKNLTRFVQEGGGGFADQLAGAVYPTADAGNKLTCVDGESLVGLREISGPLLLFVCSVGEVCQEQCDNQPYNRLVQQT